MTTVTTTQNAQGGDGGSMLLTLMKLRTFIALFAVIAFFSIFAPNFLSTANIILMSKHVALNAFLAMGMTFVIITGGKRIGRIVAQQLANRGADIVLSYRGSQTEAEQTVCDVRARGRRAIAVAADVTASADCIALVHSARDAFGRVDALVNMASVYGSTPFDALTEDVWDRDLKINLKSAFLCAKAAIPAMRETGGGRIINFADWLARSGRPNYRGFVSYYVAKAGIIALSESMALELAADQILVNAIAPGPILAPPDMPPEEVAAVAAATPVGRWGGEVEIAKAVLTLLETDFITGETIRVDGGRHVA